MPPIPATAIMVFGTNQGFYETFLQGTFVRESEESEGYEEAHEKATKKPRRGKLFLHGLLLAGVFRNFYVFYLAFMYSVTMRIHSS